MLSKTEEAKLLPTFPGDILGFLWRSPEEKALGSQEHLLIQTGLVGNLCNMSDLENGAEGKVTGVSLC